MAERVVVNTGPLIAQQRVNALDVIGRLKSRGHGLLGRAKELGFVSAVGPFVEALRVSGWYAPAVIEWFLSTMGE